MTITIPAFICLSLICALIGAIIATVIVWKYQDRFWSNRLKYITEESRYYRHQVDNWKHWTNVYRHLLEESEKKNTIIINERPKGANIPKFGD